MVRPMALSLWFGRRGGVVAGQLIANWWFGALRRPQQTPSWLADCGRSSEVERQLPKLNVRGSIPLARSRNSIKSNSLYRALAVDGSLLCILGWDWGTTSARYGCAQIGSV